MFSFFFFGNFRCLTTFGTYFYKNMKYILVTGGVMSGVGKGIIASSIGTLLKSCGVHVTSIKIDPYLNIDAGTFSPYEHGMFRHSGNVSSPSFTICPKLVYFILNIEELLIFQEKYTCWTTVVK